MKEIFTFIAELFKLFSLGLWYLICEFCCILKIPLIILTALTIGGILTGKLNLQGALIFFGFSIIGIIFPAIPVWVYGKQLIKNIYITAKGKEYTGICTEFKQGSRAQPSSVLVKWTDNRNQTHRQEFEAIGIKFIYRHSVTVYSINNDQEMTNLGVLSFIVALVNFILLFIMWIVTIVCTIVYIIQM